MFSFVYVVSEINRNMYALYKKITGRGADNDSENNVGEVCDSIETVVANEDDFKEGEMRMVSIGDAKALLVKDGGEFHAVSGKCTHAGANLANGSLCNGRVRCPWHGACFNLRTGDIEDFPGGDNLQKYQVNVVKGQVKIRASKRALTTMKRQSPCCPVGDDQDGRHFVIVGGGGAGSTCAETLRKEGFAGKITMVIKEKCNPYERPKLSKALNTKASAITLRREEYYSEYNINMMTGVSVTSLSCDNKQLTLSNGHVLQYDKVFIGTGCAPRSLDLPGEDLSGISMLREVEDGNYIFQRAQDSKVVIIGTSFIGLECAAYLLDKASSVTVVGRSEVPLKHVFGTQVGLAVKKLLEDRGVNFVFSNPPRAFNGSNGELTSVVLADGSELKADLCIIGAGSTAQTQFLKDTGIAMNDSGYVFVDKYMQTYVSDVYAGGDIVCFPLFMANDKCVNVQHWQMACQHGRIAALKMIDKSEQIKSVPFFWTVMFGKSIRFAGYNGDGYDDVIIDGNPDQLKFVAYYIKSGKVVAVASLNRDPVVAKAADLFLTQRVITRAEISEDPSGWMKK